MCGGTPKVERRDLQAESLEAQATATQRANREIAQRRARRAGQSLIANPGGAAGLTGFTGESAISRPPGKQTLG